jgi:hypothetical protein
LCFTSIATECVPCRRMWCPGCYASSLLVTFHIAHREGEGIDPMGTDSNEDWMISVWRRKPRDKNTFKRARKGDELMVQFECDWCVFGKNCKLSPDPRHPSDILAMACIRHTLLDAFWSRESSTRQAALIRKGILLSKGVGWTPPYHEQGPLPLFDHCGYEVAI